MNENSNGLKRKAVGGVIWKGLERICAQLVSAIVSIILARILIPDDYSVVSVVTIFFTFCSIFISGGLNTALVQKKDADIIDYSTILIANMCMATILYATMFFCAPLIADLFKKELLLPIIRVMALTFFVNGYKAVLSAKITADLNFKVFFWSTIIGTIISAAVGIGMAFNGYGPWALVAQQMTNSLIDSIILSFTSKIKFKVNFSFERFKGLFRFGGKIMLSALINELYNQTKPLIVGLKFSTVDLAFYNKGKTYPDMIANVGNDTLASSLFPTMAKVQDDKNAVLRIVRRFMQTSSFIVFPLMFGFFAVSEGFVRILLTEKWLPIVPYLMIFCVSGMFKPIQMGNLQAIRAIGRSDVYLILEIIKKASYLVIIVLFLIFTNSPIMLAVSGIITSVLASLINTYPNKKLIGYGYRKQFEDLGPNFIISAIMGVIVFLMKYIPMNIYLLTFLQVFTGAAIYIGINYLIKNQSMFYTFRTIKEMLKSKRDIG